jgi:hypothetical protein
MSSKGFNFNSYPLTPESVYKNHDKVTKEIYVKDRRRPVGDLDYLVRETEAKFGQGIINGDKNDLSPKEMFREYEDFN